MKKNKLISILLTVLTICLLCGCGRSTQSVSTPSIYTGYDKTESINLYGVKGSGLEGATAAAAIRESSAGAGIYDTPAGVSGEIGDFSNETITDELMPDKIIYSANSNIETYDLDEAIQKITDLVASYGGFIESKSINDSSTYYSSYRSAYFVIRIPCNEYNGILQSLSGIGKVTYLNSYAENITTDYYDLAARLKVYYTQEETLISMMRQATSVEELIDIQHELTEIRATIESMETRLRHMDRQVDYSTITIDVCEVEEFTPTAPKTFSDRLQSSIKKGWDNIVNFFEGLLLGAISCGPVVIIVLFFVFVIVKLVIKIVKKHKAKVKPD